MISKSIILLACFNVLVVAPRIDQDTPGEKKEYLEELYDGEIVYSLNSIPTLDEAGVNFHENDIRLLSEECYTNENCLNDKLESVKKYHHKMQAIQCAHGLFVLKVLDELKTIMHKTKSSKINELNHELQKPVLKQKFYLTSMLSLLNLAKWDAYAWQIEIFTFVAGLVTSDTNFPKYKIHFKNHHPRLRENVSAFISQCVQQKYLLYQSKTAFSRLVDNAYSQMDLFYRHGTLLDDTFFPHITVPNLALKHLSFHHDIILDWSLYRIKLETNNVKSQLMEYFSLYGSPESLHQWELDPIGGNKYNALIARCIHLKIVFTAWFHLYYYKNLLSRPRDEDEQQFMGKGPLVKIWHTPIFPIKRALRTFMFDGNIYWSAIRLMMVDLTKNMKEEVTAREKYTRNYFCRAVEDLGLASASDINLQLVKLEVAREHGLMYQKIKVNGEMLDDYTDEILRALSPVDGKFIRLIVSAEGNETFFLH